MRAAYRQLEGHFAFVAVHHDHPGELVGARHQCPLLVGVGRGEMFLASMAAAFISETREIQLIEDGEVVAITEDGARFLDVENGEVEREMIEVDWDLDAPRRAATRRSCSRRSTSSPKPSPRRSATASGTASSSSRASG